MTEEVLKRANEVKKRLSELDKVVEWFERKDQVYLLSKGRGSVALSHDGMMVVYGLVVEERARLRDELERM